MRHALPLVFGLPALVAIWVLGSIVTTTAPPPASADTVAADVQIGIDTDTAGNTATSLGSQETCSAIAVVGDTLEIDVVVTGIPPYDPITNSGGVAGFQFDVLYDPAVVNVIGWDADMMLAANGDPIWFSVTDPASASEPDADGDFFVAQADLSVNLESGDGVLIRITLQAVGVGTSILDLTEILAPGDGVPLIGGAGGSTYTPIAVHDAEITVGGSCTSGVLDNDVDGFSDGMELFMGTLPLQSCPETAAPHDEALDAWPPDFDDNQSVEINDLLGAGVSFKGSFGSSEGDAAYSARFDMNASGEIDITDLLGAGASFKSTFGQSCL
ncbi:MAG: hypothetical protein IIC87_01330 [Chloroflexi bacterium]|nr:hypothetical protein [Chloroflexota bacterium]